MLLFAFILIHIIFFLINENKITVLEEKISKGFSVDDGSCMKSRIVTEYIRIANKSIILWIFYIRIYSNIRPVFHIEYRISTVSPPATSESR